MHVKDMCVLIYGRFSVSYQRDATLKTEIVDSAKRGFSTNSPVVQDIGFSSEE